MESKIINPGYPVYISYSRKDETNAEYADLEIPVDHLITQLKNVGIECRIDRSHTFDTISEFERRIAKAKIVVIFLSKKYLKSKHCMYEWAEIHKNLSNNNNENSKKIIYIRYDGLHKDQFKWDLWNWYPELRQYWEQQLNIYWKNSVRDVFEPSIIDNEAYAHKFYYKEVGKIDGGTKRDKTVWYYTSDIFNDEKCTKIIENIKNFISQMELVDNYLYDTILVDKSVLMIGDSVLQYEVEGEKRPLGEYINDELLKWVKNRYDNVKSLREWNRENYDESIKEQFKVLYNKLDKNKINSKTLERLLSCHTFDVIISLGYCTEIINTIKKVYGLGITEYVAISPNTDLKNKDGFESYQVKEDNKIRVFEFVNNFNGEISNIVFSEAEIVDFTNFAIKCFYKNPRDFRNRNLLTLGANFPGWAMRFMASAFSYEKKRQQSIILNRDIDEKTKKYLSRQGNMIQKDHLIEDVVNKIVNRSETYRKNKVYHNGQKKNVYVFYFQEDLKKLSEDRDIFEEIERNCIGINFVWRDNLLQTDAEREKILEACDLFVLYRAKDTIPVSRPADDTNGKSPQSNKSGEHFEIEFINKQLDIDKATNKIVNDKIFIIFDNDNKKLENDGYYKNCLKTEYQYDYFKESGKLWRHQLELFVADKLNKSK
jgi:hypothetical protein